MPPALLRCLIFIVALCPSLSFAQYSPYPTDYASSEQALRLDRAKTLERLGVLQWHRNGCQGKGTKVAILDSGFRGYKDLLGRVLPARVTVKSFRKDGNLEAKDSQHGILCAEVIHAIAPHAQLLFANWEPNHPVKFLEAVKWAREEGAQIISCSIIMPTWSDVEGGGAVHRELKKLLGKGDKSDDALFFACAGNTAERHWGGSYVRGTHNYHLWSGDLVDNQVLPWNTGEVSVELCGAHGMDFELIVYDATTQQLLGRSTAHSNDIYQCAVVRFLPQIGHTYYARVRGVKGNKGRFHLFVLGGGIKETRSKGSIPFPGDGKEVITLGAVDDRGSRLSYSSCGPCLSHAKPNLVARVPFSSFYRARPFTGTSAAAPQAAGMAAILWARYPGSSALQIRAAMERSAVDLGREGHDGETGYGLLRAPRIQVSSK